MSEILQCASCEGSNPIPEGINSMFCAFCGGAIEKTLNDISEKANPIKFKPEITKPNVSIEEAYSPKMLGETFRERESRGWQIDQDYSSVDFTIDKKIEHGGGELVLIDRGITSLAQIIEWYTDSELATIRLLDLRDNSIDNIVGIEKFKNLIFLNLNNNKLTSLDLPGNYPYLTLIEIENNPINKIVNLPSIVRTENDRFSFQSSTDLFYSDNSVQISMTKVNLVQISIEALNSLKSFLDHSKKNIYISFNAGSQRFFETIFEYFEKENKLKGKMHVFTASGLQHIEWSDYKLRGVEQGENRFTISFGPSQGYRKECNSIISESSN